MAPVIGAVILLHAVFVLFDADPANPLVEPTTGVRDTFGWFTENLFRMDDPPSTRPINDAVAALVSVVLGSAASRFILRVAPSATAQAQA